MAHSGIASCAAPARPAAACLVGLEPGLPSFAPSAMACVPSPAVEAPTMTPHMSAHSFGPDASFNAISLCYQGPMCDTASAGLPAAAALPAARMMPTTFQWSQNELPIEAQKHAYAMLAHAYYEQQLLLGNASLLPGHFDRYPVAAPHPGEWNEMTDMPGEAWVNEWLQDVVVNERNDRHAA